jgi:hypothetical protein
MVHHVLSPHCRPQGISVFQIAGNPAQVQFFEESGFGGRADQRGDFVTLPDQGFGEMTSDKARRAGDQHLHRGLSYSR